MDLKSNAPHRVVLAESHIQLTCALKYVKEIDSTIELLIIRRNGIESNDLTIDNILIEYDSLIKNVVFFTLNLVIS